MAKYSLQELLSLWHREHLTVEQITFHASRFTLKIRLFPMYNGLILG